MGICWIALIHKGTECWYNFFLVPGNRPALLLMPDCKWMQFLSINGWTIKDSHRWKQINGQIKQDKSKPNNSAKDNPNDNNKTNHKIEYFIAGPGMEADR